MSDDAAELARLRKRLDREKAARKEAEQLLEQKSLELFQAYQRVEAEAVSLEDLVQARTAELQAALERAEAATRAKSAFLATMSHELRTPLNGVLGLSEMLLCSPLDDEQQRQVRTIATSGQNLLVLLNEILDFSKIEAGQLTLERAVYAPVTALHEVCELLGMQARLKGIDLAFDIGPGVPQWVWGDSTRIKQVWVNLLSNALKFTDNGSVQAQMRVEQQTNGLWLHGEVRDTGIGMPPEVQQRLFQAFVQADSSITRKYGGTGLGLVITRRILELMGGHISVESTVGRGTTFRFAWPLEQAPAPATTSTDGGDTALPPLRILVAEDNPVNTRVALALLKALQQTHVTCANNGKQALEQLQRDEFDVVLMDMQMPELDGLQATRQLRTLPLAHQPWVIALTANAYAEDREACTLAGMNDFLAKPISMAALRAALLRRGVAVQGLQRPAVAKPMASASAVP